MKYFYKRGIISSKTVFYKATQFPFMLKLIIKYGWNKICALNFQLVKYSCKFQPSVFTLTYRDIIERRMHNILNFHLICLPLPLLLGISHRRGIGIIHQKIVNREIFIPNLNWIKKISCYDNKKFTRRNVWHIKTS